MGIWKCDDEWDQPTTSFDVTCNDCGKVQTISVDPEGFIQWRTLGMHIQRALPDNTPAERELLVSRTCEACWDNMFPPLIEDEWAHWRPDNGFEDRAAQAEESHP